MMAIQVALKKIPCSPPQERAAAAFQAAVGERILNQLGASGPCFLLALSLGMGAAPVAVALGLGGWAFRSEGDQRTASALLFSLP